MEKFIAAIDGLKYSDSTAHYATHLAQQASAHLVGVFLEDITYHSYKVYDLVGDKGLMEENMVRLEEQDKERREESVQVFEEVCKHTNINFSVHRDRNIAIHELLHESIYADLLIIDSKETLTHYDESKPTRFMRDLLEQVQCPVLVVPSKYQPIDKVVLLYDGSPSSVFAIRAFCDVLACCTTLPVELVTVTNDKTSTHVPDHRLIKEFLKRHIAEVTFTVFKGDPETEIVSYIKKQLLHPLVVLGAYRRGMVSRWFKPSMADALMQQLKVPLFIAHNK